MSKVTPGNIIQTAIISAFTIAAALIWKDVIIDFIQVVVPPSQALTYKFVAAVLATGIVVVAIYALLKTESEAEHMLSSLRKRNSKGNSRRNSG